MKWSLKIIIIHGKPKQIYLKLINAISNLVREDHSMFVLVYEIQLIYWY